MVERTTELANLTSQDAQIEAQARTVNEAIAAARARENEALERERVCQSALRSAREEARMNDLVVREYAALVRDMDGRSSSPEKPPRGAMMVSADEAREGVRKILDETDRETNALHKEISSLHARIEDVEAQLVAVRQVGEEDRDKLALARVELERYKADDNSAAKLVSRYMYVLPFVSNVNSDIFDRAFSQSSTDTLQEAVTSSRARHAATTSTQTHHIRQLEHSLSIERTRSDRLRAALDDLTEDI